MQTDWQTERVHRCYFRYTILLIMNKIKFIILLIAATTLYSCGNNGNNAGNESNSNEAAEDSVYGENEDDMIGGEENGCDDTDEDQKAEMKDIRNDFEIWLNEVAKKLKPEDDMLKADEDGVIQHEFTFHRYDCLNQETETRIHVDSARNWMCYDILLRGRTTCNNRFSCLGWIFFEKENGNYKLKLAKRWKVDDEDIMPEIRVPEVDYVWQKDEEPMLLLVNGCSATDSHERYVWLCNTEGHVYFQVTDEDNVDYYDDKTEDKWTTTPEFVYDSLSHGKPYIRLKQHEVHGIFREDYLKGNYHGNGSVFADSTTKDSIFMLKYMPLEDKYIYIDCTKKAEYSSVSLTICG